MIIEHCASSGYYSCLLLSEEFLSLNSEGLWIDSIRQKGSTFNVLFEIVFKCCSLFLSLKCCSTTLKQNQRYNLEASQFQRITRRKGRQCNNNHNNNNHNNNNKKNTSHLNLKPHRNRSEIALFPFWIELLVCAQWCPQTTLEPHSNRTQTALKPHSNQVDYSLKIALKLLRNS